MAIINSFLCWSNTRTGTAVCGYYTLIISVVCLAFYMLRYIALDDLKDSIELKGIVYAGFVLYSFLIGVSLILLPGVYMDRRFLLLPWIYVLVITVLYETGAIALVTTVHLEQDHTLDVWEIVAVVFYCLRLIANCYCFACVVSQYQELSEGRGTYEYLFKPWRRQMMAPHLNDFEEYNPPYGATLPPYSEENPFKEFSPPNYENLELQDGEQRRPLQSVDNDAVTPQTTTVVLEAHRTSSSLNLGPDHFMEVSPIGCDGLSISSSMLDSYGYDFRDYNCEYEFNSFDLTGHDTLNSRSSLPRTVDHSRSSSLSCDSGHFSLYSHHRQHSRSLNDSSIAMTSSSGHISNSASDNSYHSYMTPKSSRPKRAPSSPLVIHKRTYITWI
nr:hypothetical protein BgiMline_010494 [Biomphalaria glabrata]